jgi:hypothetical protein
MGTQKHLDTEVICPVSGLKLNGVVIPMHRMAMFQCENGALFARCPNHVVRTFISDFTTVRHIMNQAIITQITERKNPRKKEKSNGTT